MIVLSHVTEVKVGPVTQFEVSKVNQKVEISAYNGELLVRRMVLDVEFSKAKQQF